MNDRSARALLGVSPSATTGQIKRAYRRLALDLHPDRGGDPEQFQRVVEAHALLLAQPVSEHRTNQPTRWEQAASSVGQRRLVDNGVTRRRQTAPTPVRQRSFGDVLAEKLAAA